MSKMKAYLEDLSVEMGYEGAITDEVLQEADARFHSKSEDVEVATCVGCGHEFCYEVGGETPDLCKTCATIACEEGLSSYTSYVSTPAPPYYVSAFGTAVPFPTEE